MGSPKPYTMDKRKGQIRSPVVQETVLAWCGELGLWIRVLSMCGRRPPEEATLSRGDLQMLEIFSNTSSLLMHKSQSSLIKTNQIKNKPN